MSRKRLIFLLLLGDTDDTTGRSSPSIASRFAEFVPAFAEIILVCVNDHGTTDDRVGPRQADETVRDLAEEEGNSFKVIGLASQKLLDYALKQRPDKK